MSVWHMAIRGINSRTPVGTSEVTGEPARADRCRKPLPEPARTDARSYADFAIALKYHGQSSLRASFRYVQLAPARLGVALGCALYLASACGSPGPLEIDGATLAILAAGHDEMPAEAKGAPRVAVLPDQPVTIPDAPVIQVAIDRLVFWQQVQAVLAPMEAKGQKPVFLIANRRRLAAFHLNDELRGPIVELYAEVDGKICVKHPEIPEAKCNQGMDKKFIDPSFTRELAREGVNGYKRTNIEVDLPAALTWGDVVSAIGGARSCCGNRNIRVRVKE